MMAIRQIERSWEELRLSEEEQEAIKNDLLAFVHKVAGGEINTPEQVNMLCPVVELLAKYF